MSNEGVAEEVHEATLELFNPGGDPDVLRGAAKGWNDMHDHLEEMFRHLNGQVERTVGEHWRGESADAFLAHWRELKKDVDETLPAFKQAADGLKKAADNIEKINDEIHQIYVEIGVSIGISAGLSLLTMGFSAAAGAANAARLAAQASKLATTLGRILETVAKLFRAIPGVARIRAIAQGSKFGRIAVEMGAQYTSGFVSGVGTSLASGKGPEWQDNAINAGWGTLLGAGAGGRLGGGLAEGALVGGVSSVAGDLTNNAFKDEKDKTDADGMIIGAAVGAAGGAGGSALTSRAVDGRGLSGARELGVDISINNSIGFITGEQGNDIKDADEAEGKAGEQASGKLREKPDTSKFGAFG